ncbi:uncharacterized protein CMU_018510 [Cryptosporidium muris RN66]|uniref:Histone-binding protein RBBP4-like N-terminal domain-containing protein n=1 Tax=Cryptosporidium muris (strain RN66) TaxID=441375 RepID=B6AD90_CRYMR|nr:uncharacterized protein CMU_018510 [Cryptosporidium muris RN66]EEA06094.1 hypothetical protein, conserved [Cryptosporidium muris RN66]|eukprot:XP_002140443.1 hypothetical protein [Cryptosporidium muris RN66]
MGRKIRVRQENETTEEILPSKYKSGSSKSQSYKLQDQVMSLEGQFAEEYEDEIEDEVTEVEDTDSLEYCGETIKEVINYWTPEIVDETDLVYEPSAYKMYHKCIVEWSCLSFDIIPDGLGSIRKQFPHTCYVAAGTQANRDENNRILLMKWSKLHKTKRDRNDEDSISSSSDSCESDLEYIDEDPVLNVQSIPHKGTINRIRVCPQYPSLLSTWSELGVVNMWDVSDALNGIINNFTNSGVTLKVKTEIKPKLTYEGHLDEGFAMDWNPNSPIEFISGDRKGKISLWEPTEDGSWKIRDVYRQFQSSVEILQWMKEPSHNTIFAAGFVDSNINIIDTRSDDISISIHNAHNGDINTLSWNPGNEYLLLSGSDDCDIKLWDTRTNNTLETFKWHKQPILSVDWLEIDSDVFLAASLDNSISFWDIGIEQPAVDDEKSDNVNINVPYKILFLHMGQNHIAEAKWHKQIPNLVISTAQDSFNIFIPDNL